MRVLNVIEEGRYGGPQSVIVDNAAAINNSISIENIILFPENKSGRFEEKINENGLRYEKVSITNPSTGIKNTYDYFRTFVKDIFKICNTIEKVNPDIIHCHNPFQVKGVVASALKGIPVVWHLHDTYSPKLVRVTFYLLSFLLVNNFILASRSTKKYYVGDTFISNRNTKVIQSPVDTNHFNPDCVSEEGMISKYDGLRVSTVCTIRPIKRIEIFIEVARRVSTQTSKRVNFFIVGGFIDTKKNYKKKIYNILNKERLDNIHIMGHTQNVRGVLKGTDVYMCTSKSESSPVSIWEAMSMKVPVITTDVGDVSCFLEGKDIKAGEVVGGGDPDEMKEALMKVLNNESLRMDLGQNARQIARNHMDVSVTSYMTEKFYRQILGK